jgi:hypothetical protein
MEDLQHTHKATQLEWLLWLQWIFWGQWRSQDLCLSCGQANLAAYRQPR